MKFTQYFRFTLDTVPLRSLTGAGALALAWMLGAGLPAGLAQEAEIAQVAETAAAEEVFTQEALALAPEVYQLFDRSCAYCHDSTARKPKGSFGFIMDFERLRTDPDYIVPGDAMDSEVYLLIIDPDEEFVMPPPDSEQPMLTAEEAEKVKAWINGGAPPVPPAPAVVDVSAETGDLAPPVVVQERTERESLEKKGPSLRVIYARLHPLVVHFPIALLLFGVMFEAARQFRPQGNFEVIVFWSLLFGSLGAIASATTGWLLADITGHPDAKLVLHRWSGIAVAGLGVLAFLLQMRLTRQDTRINRIIFWLILLFITLAVSIAGHTGGELVYGENYLFS